MIESCTSTQKKRFYDESFLPVVGNYPFSQLTSNKSKYKQRHAYSSDSLPSFHVVRHFFFIAALSDKWNGNMRLFSKPGGWQFLQTNEGYRGRGGVCRSPEQMYSLLKSSCESGTKTFALCSTSEGRGRVCPRIALLDCWRTILSS